MLLHDGESQVSRYNCGSLDLTTSTGRAMASMLSVFAASETTSCEKALVLVWIMLDKVVRLGRPATAARKTAGVRKLFSQLSPNPRLPGGYASTGPQRA